MHPASLRAITDFWDALALERLSLGIVQPQPGTDRGRGWWQTDLPRPEFMRALPRVAATNVNGAHVYIRVPHATADDEHCGVVMLDDLDKSAVTKLEADGFEASATVETSPGNHQCWIRLVPSGTGLPTGVVRVALNDLIFRYGSDPRAASPTQPGRLPGFTNRKMKYCRSDGRYPFVRLIGARAGLVCTAAPALLQSVRAQQAQAGAPRAATPKTPPAAVFPRSVGWRELDFLRRAANSHIAFELRAGLRAPERASPSEVDWLTVMRALRAGYDPAEIEAWLHASRPERGTRYAQRTVCRAMESFHADATLTPKLP